MSSFFSSCFVSADNMQCTSPVNSRGDRPRSPAVRVSSYPQGDRDGRPYIGFPLFDRYLLIRFSRREVLLYQGCACFLSSTIVRLCLHLKQIGRVQREQPEKQIGSQFGKDPELQNRT